MPINLAALVDDIVEKHRMKAEKDVTFTVDTPSDFTVNADRMHLSNIMNNLIDNAVKYSGEKVAIHIAAEEDRLTVSDSGSIFTTAIPSAQELSMASKGATPPKLAP